MERDSLVSTRTMELITAGLLVLIGAVVMIDSWRIGAGWGSDGPQSGYFPFYIGLMIFGSSAAIFVMAFMSKEIKEFVNRESFARVTQVLWPTIGYGVLIALLGIYVASAIFIGYFMRRVGRYAIPVTLAVSIGVPLALFLTFEVWFLVPLPKGPLEDLLGY